MLGRDETETIEWIKKGAQRGNVLAQFNLGGAYLKGKGVYKNNVEAYRWLFLSAEGGHNEALAICDALAKKMEPADVAEAKKLAQSWRAASEKNSNRKL